MNINIYGMGYVGCVSGACFAAQGHHVTGVDVDPVKVDAINSGKSPIVEPTLEELIKSTVSSGSFRAGSKADCTAQVSIVCVGTPSNDNGSLGLHYLTRVAEQIGDYVKARSDYHVVNIRSTVLPGTIEEKVIPILEARSGKKAGEEFGVCMNPEFMRESTSVHDFYHPPFTLVGELDRRSGDVVEQIYEGLEAPLLRSTIRVAEMIKYACNSWHALKVSFANEIGNLCKKAGIDGHKVMEVFCTDTKLNLSSYYMKPGFAFGGSCLPKDVRALLYMAKDLDVKVPVLESILPSNQRQLEIGYELVRATGKKNIGVLGMSFKHGTDDLRDSPLVELIERLIGKGYHISIYDREVSLAKIFGSNKRFIEQAIPHVSSLLRESLDQVVADSEVILIGKKDPMFERVVKEAPPGKLILDLVRITKNVEQLGEGYDGICW